MPTGRRRDDRRWPPPPAVRSRARGWPRPRAGPLRGARRRAVVPRRDRTDHARRLPRNDGVADAGVELVGLDQVGVPGQHGLRQCRLDLRRGPQRATHLARDGLGDLVLALPARPGCGAGARRARPPSSATSGAGRPEPPSPRRRRPRRWRTAPRRRLFRSGVLHVDRLVGAERHPRAVYVDSCPALHHGVITHSHH